MINCQTQEIAYWELNWKLNQFLLSKNHLPFDSDNSLHPFKTELFQLLILAGACYADSSKIQKAFFYIQYSSIHYRISCTNRVGWKHYHSQKHFSALDKHESKCGTLFSAGGYHTYFVEQGKKDFYICMAGLLFFNYHFYNWKPYFT